MVATVGRGNQQCLKLKGPFKAIDGSNVMASLLNEKRKTDGQRRVDNRIDLVLVTTIAGAGFLA
jgi:hypothetical protein